MSFNFLPKSVFKGTNSDGTTFTAREYDFGTFAVLELGSFLGYLLVGGIFCAIISPIMLVMIMLTFTGRFNFIYLLIFIFSGYFIYDCAQGWLFSAFLNIFIEEGGLIFLTCINIGCFVIISILTLFGKTIVNVINTMSDDVNTRYIIFFVATGVVFLITYLISGSIVDVNWLGVTEGIKNMKLEN